MNIVEELKLHIDALSNVVEDEPKFFVSIMHYTKRLKELIRSPIEEVSQEEFKLLVGKIEEFYARYRPSGNSTYIPPKQTYYSDSTVREINIIAEKLTTLDEDSFKALFPSKKSLANSDISDKKSVHSPCVFIGHGRNKLWARLKMYLEDELDLPIIAYESESHTGESIVPVLEKILDKATFAVLVLTAEDETKVGTRARQNVIHEAGLFQGRLGFRRTVILKQEGLEDFTNVAGLQYIGFTGDQIEQTFYELQRVLKREKMLVFQK
jgi:predicted nucleotide-binding protein